MLKQISFFVRSKSDLIKILSFILDSNADIINSNLKLFLVDQICYKKGFCNTVHGNRSYKENIIL